MMAMINVRTILFFIILQVMLLYKSNAQSIFSSQNLEIALPSLKGDMIRLSDYKGKVILIDFWASWCGPCRLSNKNLVKIYDKYKKKGFEIFGVSIDENFKAWEKAVKTDKVTWVQVIDKGGWQAGTAMKWNVSYLPTTYLISTDGKLIARDPDKKELEKLLDNLLN